MTCSFDEECGGTLRVSVRDNGRGLSDEGKQRLFRPFSQAEGQETKNTYGGTGLGLARPRLPFLLLAPQPASSQFVERTRSRKQYHPVRAALALCCC